MDSTTTKSYGFLHSFPGEVRNMIYEHVFHNESTLGNWHHEPSKKYPRGFFAGKIHMSLAFTCRQIYNETRTFALSVNDFTIGELSLTRLPRKRKGDSGAVTFIRQFLNTPQIEAFTRLTMSMTDFVNDFAGVWKTFGPLSGGHLKKLTLTANALQETRDRKTTEPDLCEQLGLCFFYINQLRGVDKISLQIWDWQYSRMAKRGRRIITDVDAHPTDSRHYHVEQRRFISTGGLDASELFMRNGRWEFPTAKHHVNPRETHLRMHMLFDFTRQDPSHHGNRKPGQQAEGQARRSLQDQETEQLRAFKETLTSTHILVGSNYNIHPILSGDHNYFLWSVPEVTQARIDEVVETEESDEDDVNIPGRKRRRCA